MSTDTMQATPVAVKQAAPALTSPQKAAIVITALPPDDAGSLLQKLGPPHIRAYVTATRQLRHVPAQTLERVIIEFLESLENTDITMGPETAQEILSRIMSPDAVSAIIGEATGAPRTVWQQVHDLPDADIAAFIEREHPRAAALLMSRLAPEKAASVFDVLPAEAAEQVVAMLKNAGEVQPAVLAIVEESIRSDLLKVSAGQGDPPDVFVGAVFDNLTEKAREPLMKSLTEKSPEFATAVARRMFLFDDIPNRLEEKDVPVLTRVIEQAVLSVALGYATSRKSDAADYILVNLPKRMAEQIREAIEESGTIEQGEGEAAEAEVIKSIRNLVAAGEVKLKPAG